MRVNVWAEEVDGEVLAVQKHTPDGVFQGARIVIKSPPELHFRDGESESAVTFWFTSKKQRNAFASAVALTINQTEDEK